MRMRFLIGSFLYVHCLVSASKSETCFPFCVQGQESGPECDAPYAKQGSDAAVPQAHRAQEEEEEVRA